jgi:hypothetical protein
MNQQGREAFQRIEVDAQDEGQVLERILKRRFSDWSWGDVRQTIRGRRIDINGNLCVDRLRKDALARIVDAGRSISVTSGHMDYTLSVAEGLAAAALAGDRVICVPTLVDPAEAMSPRAAVRPVAGAGPWPAPARHFTFFDFRFLDYWILDIRLIDFRF